MDTHLRVGKEGWGVSVTHHDPKCASLLKELPSTQELHKSVKDAEAIYVVEVSKLEKITIQTSALTDQGLAHFSQLGILEALHL